MLIQLTQRGTGGGPGSPVLVGSDHIIQAVPAAGGCTLMLVGGFKLDVTEGYDEVMDLQCDAKDEGAQRKAKDERKKQREERKAEEEKRVAGVEQSRRQREAQAAHDEWQRQQRAALGAAEAAKRLGREAGMPVTDNVTPDGVDEKHPAPQPHQMGPPALHPEGVPGGPVPSSPPQEPRAIPPGGAFVAQRQQQAQEAKGESEQEKSVREEAERKKAAEESKAPPPQSKHGRK